MNSFSRDPIESRSVATKYRTINGVVPAVKTHPTIEKSLKFEPSSMNDDLPIVWDRAEGCQIYDEAGNRWLDFTSCIFVANVGHSHPKVVQAIKESLNKPILNTYYYPTKHKAEFAEILISQLPAKLNTALFLSTGSEASEAAIKIAMIRGRKKDPRKEYVVGFEGSFHGKTMGAQTLGGKPSGKKWIGESHSKIVHLPYPYPWVLKQTEQSGAAFFRDSIRELEAKGIESKNVAAIMMEPYQGWCGAFFPQDYMAELQVWAKANDVLIGFDEVQSGFGRTGFLFGYQYYDHMVPDIIWCGKAISASIPVSAVIADRAIISVDPSLNSTHGGNPLGMAACKASMEALLEENMIAESMRKGILVEKTLRSWAEDHKKYRLEVFGSGLMWAILVRDRDTGELQVPLVDKHVETCFRKGLLTIRTTSGSIKLGPPLMIPDEALMEGLDVIIDTFEDLAANSH